VETGWGFASIVLLAAMLLLSVFAWWRINRIAVRIPKIGEQSNWSHQQFHAWSPWKGREQRMYTAKPDTHPDRPIPSPFKLLRRSTAQVDILKSSDLRHIGGAFRWCWKSDFSVRLPVQFSSPAALFLSAMSWHQRRSKT